jgi:hypothetical protein
MKSLALVLIVSLCSAGCMATVKREGEVLFLYCTVFCLLRIDNADTAIESKLKQALSPREDRSDDNGP